jgi:hypothetical protein
MCEAVQSTPNVSDYPQRSLFCNLIIILCYTLCIAQIAQTYMTDYDFVQAL